MLSTVAKVKAHVGIKESDTSKDAILEVILKGASKWIENKTGRNFELLERTEFYDGAGTDELFLNQYPIDEVTEIKLSGTAIDMDAETANDNLIIDETMGSIFRRSGWPEGRKNISVKYTAGYVLPDTDESGETPNLPEDLELAAIRLTARVYERRTAEGVTSVSPASFSANFASDVDSDIMATINHYRKLKV